MHADALHSAGLVQRKYGMLLLLLLACAAEQKITRLNGFLSLNIVNWQT